ncbi:hypothetical protein Pelo_4946 [Pelomyxa schiedti]|nr:hypothetical protein Pelo_4946 [Pelomyxa schiedti]
MYERTTRGTSAPSSTHADPPTATGSAAATIPTTTATTSTTSSTATTATVTGAGSVSPTGGSGGDGSAEIRNEALRRIAELLHLDEEGGAGAETGVAWVAAKEVVKTAMKLFGNDKYKKAVATLCGVISDYPDYPPGYLVLGEFYQQMGQVERACSIWKVGIERCVRKGREVLLMCKFVASTRLLQGEQGSGTLITMDGMRRGDPVTASATEENTWRNSKLKEAAEYYGIASSIVPPKDSSPFLDKQAVCFVELKEWDLAIKCYESGRKLFRDSKWAINKASCYLAKGGDDALLQSIPLLEEALELDPRAKDAYEMLADLYSLEDQVDKVTLYKDYSKFYAFFPEFCRRSVWSRAYSDLVKVLIPTPTSSEQPPTLPTNPDDPSLHVIQTLKSLADDPSDTATEIVLAFCWNHFFHGPAEDAAYEILQAKTVDVNSYAFSLLDNLIHFHQCTCTIKNTCHVMAANKDPRCYDICMSFLKQDLEDNSMGIVESLSLLGDERAVPELVKVMELGLDVDDVNSDDDTPPESEVTTSTTSSAAAPPTSETSDRTEEEDEDEEEEEEEVEEEPEEKEEDSDEEEDDDDSDEDRDNEQARQRMASLPHDDADEHNGTPPSAASKEEALHSVRQRCSAALSATFPTHSLTREALTALHEQHEEEEATGATITSPQASESH